MARLLYRSAYIRLTTEEGFEVHRQTIEWGKHFSEDRIPEQAVGVEDRQGVEQHVVRAEMPDRLQGLGIG